LLWWCMEAAVKEGNAERLSELMSQDPTFDVNQQDVDGYTLLNQACVSGTAAVIPLLLGHPGIDVNLKSLGGDTPFMNACFYGRTPCVREMLGDSRVKVNERNNGGHTPLRWVGFYGYLEILRWWMASGRELDLGEAGDWWTDAVGQAREEGKTDEVTLLESFTESPEETRYHLRVALGCCCRDELAAEVFALVVFVSDGLLQAKGGGGETPPLPPRLPPPGSLVSPGDFPLSCR